MSPALAGRFFTTSTTWEMEYIMNPTLPFPSIKNYFDSHLPTPPVHFGEGDGCGILNTRHHVTSSVNTRGCSSNQWRLCIRNKRTCQQNEHSSSKQRNPSHNSVAILIKVSSFLALPAPPHPPLHTLASMCLSAMTATAPPPEPEGPKKHFGPLLWHVSPLILQVLHTRFTAA